MKKKHLIISILKNIEIQKEIVKKRNKRIYEFINQ